MTAPPRPAVTAYNTINYAVLQRLRFIEVMIGHCSQLNRAALVTYFGISVPQASADIQQYIKLAPENAIYCKSRKIYVRGPQFNPIFP